MQIYYLQNIDENIISNSPRNYVFVYRNLI